MSDTVREPDRRAWKILERTYWSSAGWRSERSVEPQDLAYAISAGLMFEPQSVVMTHDQVVEAAVVARDALAIRTVASTFASTLTTRRLDLRSALGSLATTLHLQPHAYERWFGNGACGTCGEYPEISVDWNVLNFERFKWGGVRHDKAQYVAFDLGQFAIWHQEPSPATLDLLDDVLTSIGALPPTATAGHAADALRSLLKSNDAERRTIVQILAMCGVLQPRSLPSMRERLVSVKDQNASHPGGRNDWWYPAFAWRGSDGVDADAVAFWWPDRSR